ncbi:hypothetical protein QBC44DRAFT_302234 [Cladorrhinum sp. PSN332]|nr:hypothetical protein QBC44DRAFT_302234 [Cladorrhinum sp. PSN332]
MQDELRKLGSNPTPEEQEIFIDGNKGWLRSPTQPQVKTFGIHKRNFLYRLAQDGSDASWLVKHLVADSEAFRDQDTDGRTSLMLAICRRQTEFVRAVLDSKVKEADLQHVLGTHSRNNESCIHQAISEGLNPGITVQLIEKTPTKSLSAQDLETSRTALHYAVEYPRLTRARLEVVRSLIKFGDGALDTKTKRPNYFSVYQYLEDSKRQYKKAREERMKPTRNKTEPGVGGDRPEPRHRRDITADSQGPSLRGTTGDSTQRPKPPTRDLDTRGPVGRVGHEDDWERVPKQGPHERGGEFRPPLSTGPSKSKSQKLPGSREKPSETVAKLVSKELKLHYLRSIFSQFEGQVLLDQAEQTPPKFHRTRDTAIRFLYGDNKDDKHIDFTFPPIPSDKPATIHFGDFEASYGRLTFDSTLLSVDFGRIVLERAVNRGKPIKPEGSGTGRRDIEKFFEWLNGKKSKGVDTIIKLTVEDRIEGLSPHSDEAIEAVLQRFDIEILDWRKIDIDPRVLRQGLKGGDESTLRELHLWWSGNNALLRAWSEPEGLPKLNSLTRIILHQDKQTLESAERIRTYVEEFKLRLRNNRSKTLEEIRVQHLKAGGLSQRIAGPRVLGTNKRKEVGSQINPHQWLSVMDTFSEGIQSLKPPSDFTGKYLDHDGLPSELRKEVRVALIDDGADFMHQPIKGFLENGRSFQSDDGYDDLDGRGRPTSSSFHGSTTGHGTLMAYLIGRICPTVKIFVCKLETEGGHGASFTAKSAADAVEFAVKRGFDIISMSWTIQRRTDEERNNSADIERLEKALKSAVDQKRLIFCAAPDIGTTSRELLEPYYPFSCPGISDSIFKIGGATSDGRMYRWSGDLRSVDFILPGEGVEIREKDRVREQDDIPKTGSSVATALAAGLAALIIHCVRLGAIYNFHSSNRRGPDTSAVNKSSVVAIKQFSAMREAFLKLRDLAGDRDKDRRIEVENFFVEPAKDLNQVLENEDFTPKWERIAGIARDLISSKAVAKANQG